MCKTLQKLAGTEWLQYLSMDMIGSLKIGSVAQRKESYSLESELITCTSMEQRYLRPLINGTY